MAGTRSKLGAALAKHGPLGVARLAYRAAVPKRAACFAAIKDEFSSRVGLEVGGPSQIFSRRGLLPVYPQVKRIDGCNFGHETVWEGELREGGDFVFDSAREPGRQFICEAADLSGIADAHYDFLLSSHCIEHLANPLKAMQEWVRVIKPDAPLALVVPHKAGTFDHRRPVTSFSHLLEDYAADRQEDDMTHFDEILRLHDLERDPGISDRAAFEQRSRENAVNRCFHQHVFDSPLAAQVVDHTGLQILAVEVHPPYHILILARRPEHGEAIDNERFLGIDAVPC
ncbi:MAG: hypothetical protein Cons2KO_18870 [Congregibacter sp.]